MHEAMMIVVASLAGGALGTFFFGGLWWTVRRGLRSKTPARWFFTSFVVRFVVVMAGFSLISKGHWKQFAGCLLGFMIARGIITRLMRPPLDGEPRAEREARHAP